MYSIDDPGDGDVLKSVEEGFSPETGATVDSSRNLDRFGFAGFGMDVAVNTLPLSL